MFKVKMYIVAILISLLSTFTVQAKNTENGIINKLFINYDTNGTLDLNISQNGKIFTKSNVNDLYFARSYEHNYDKSIDLIDFLIIPKLYKLDKYSAYIIKNKNTEYHVSSHAIQENEGNYLIPFKKTDNKKIDIHNVVYFTDGEYKEYEIKTVKYKKLKNKETRYFSEKDRLYTDLWSHKKPFNELENDLVSYDYTKNSTYQINGNEITITRTNNRYDLSIYINNKNKVTLKKDQKSITLKTTI